MVGIDLSLAASQRKSIAEIIDNKNESQLPNKRYFHDPGVSRLTRVPEKVTVSTIDADAKEIMFLIRSFRASQ